MIDLEVVAPSDGRKERGDHRLVEILDPLTSRAHEVVVVRRVARDVGRDVAVALEATRHTVLDLRLERAVHGRPAERRMTGVDPQVQLLRREGAPGGGEGLGDDDALSRQAPSARDHPLGDRDRPHAPRIRGPGAFDTRSHPP